MKRRLTMFLASFFLILGEVMAQTKVTGTEEWGIAVECDGFASGA